MAHERRHHRLFRRQKRVPNGDIPVLRCVARRGDHTGRAEKREGWAGLIVALEGEVGRGVVGRRAELPETDHPVRVTGGKFVALPAELEVIDFGHVRGGPDRGQLFGMAKFPQPNDTVGRSAEVVWKHGMRAESSDIFWRPLECLKKNENTPGYTRLHPWHIGNLRYQWVALGNMESHWVTHGNRHHKNGNRDATTADECEKDETPTRKKTRPPPTFCIM